MSTSSKTNSIITAAGFVGDITRRGDRSCSSGS